MEIGIRFHEFNFTSSDLPIRRDLFVSTSWHVYKCESELDKSDMKKLPSFNTALLGDLGLRPANFEFSSDTIQIEPFKEPLEHFKVTFWPSSL